MRRRRPARGRSRRRPGARGSATSSSEEARRGDRAARDRAAPGRRLVLPLPGGAAPRCRAPRRASAAASGGAADGPACVPLCLRLRRCCWPCSRAYTCRRAGMRLLEHVAALVEAAQLDVRREAVERRRGREPDQLRARTDAPSGSASRAHRLDDLARAARGTDRARSSTPAPRPRCRAARRSRARRAARRRPPGPRPRSPARPRRRRCRARR